MMRSWCVALKSALKLMAIINSLIMAAAPLMAHAGPNRDARLVVALTPAASGSPCHVAGERLDTTNLQVKGTLRPVRYFASVLATRIDGSAGLSAVQFGVRYQPESGEGVDVLGWTSCAPVVEADRAWPSSGTGIRLGWPTGETCRPGAVLGGRTGAAVVVGYFYCTAYGFDSLLVTPHPIDRMALVKACDGEPDTLESPDLFWRPSHLGAATFSPGGLIDGYNADLPISRSFHDEELYTWLLPPMMTDEQREILWTAEWPLPLVLGAGQWVLLENRCYRAGSHMEVSYDKQRRALMIDGLPWEEYDRTEPYRGLDELRHRAWFDWAESRILSAIAADEPDPILFGAAWLDSAGYDAARCVVENGTPIYFAHGSEARMRSLCCRTDPLRSSLVRPELRARLAAFQLLSWERPARRPTLAVRQWSSLFGSDTPDGAEGIAILEAACGDSSRWKFRFPTRELTRMATPGDKGAIIICMP
jgi:hypothetical protein